MQSGLSAQQGAAIRDNQQRKSEEHWKRIGDDLVTSTQRSEEIETVIKELKDLVKEQLIYSFRDQGDRRYGSLKVPNAQYDIYINKGSYSMYMYAGRGKRDCDDKPFEGETQDLNTFLGSLGYVMGVAFPDKAAVIDEIIKKHSPTNLDQASFTGVK